MDEKQLEKQESAETSKEAPKELDPMQFNAIEKFYENFRGIPLKYLDIFIAVCVVGLIATIALGVLKAKGFL